MKQKPLQKGQYYFVWYTKKFFSHFPTKPDHLRRFPKTTEDPRRLPKISEDYRRFPRRNPEIFDYISLLYSHVKDVFLRFTMLNKNDRCHSFLVQKLSMCHTGLDYQPLFGK